MTDEITRETFEACRQREFRVAADHLDGVEELVLDLDECAPLPARGRKGGREPFSLLFTGPTRPVLPQRIYRLENDELGVLEIFLVPVGSDDGATRYEAVFN